MSKIISLDTETTGLAMFHDSAAFMVCTLDEDENYRTWEWSVDPHTRIVQYDSRTRELAEYIAHNEIVFHHADFDIRALALMGIGLATESFQYPNTGKYVGELRHRVPVKKIHDTQLLSHVVNSQGTGDSDSELGRHALKPLALHYLNIPEGDETDLRKATIAARRIAKDLGWKRGKNLDGKPAIPADYWMPKTIYREVSVHKAYGSKKDYFTELDVPESWNTLCETYCKGDVYRTIGLFFFLQEMLEQEPALKKQYERELRCLPCIHLMEHFGMYVNEYEGREYHRALLDDAASLKRDSEELLCKASGRVSINCNSGPGQLAPALSECGITLTVRTKPSKKFPQGQWCTDAKTLRSIAQYCEYHPIDWFNSDSGANVPKYVGEALRNMVGWHPDEGDDDITEFPVPGYKSFQTGAGYVAGYLRSLDYRSVIHPSYAQVGTAWTRLACREPNGQNISVKSVLPLRRLFGPPPGYVWFDIDYSQLELRIFASASKDRNLLAAFDSGYDFHTVTACQLFNLPPEKINKEQRRIAKNVNFGIIFGAGPAKIDATTGQPGTYQLYLDKFPDAKKFMRATVNLVEQTGYVYTLTGYKLRVPDEKPYAGVNGVVQGTAGDLAKLAMIDIHERGLVDWKPPTSDLPYGGSAIVANIHDALVIQVPQSYPYKEIGRAIMQTMEAAGKYAGVVTPVDCKLTYTNWTEGEKFV